MIVLDEYPTEYVTKYFNSPEMQKFIEDRASAFLMTEYEARLRVLEFLLDEYKKDNEKALNDLKAFSYDSVQDKVASASKYFDKNRKVERCKK